MNRKSNIGLSISLAGSIIAAGALSILVFMSFAGLAGSTWGIVLVQVLNLFILFGLIYLNLWLVGEKDINYVKTGFITYDSFTGLKIGLYAMPVMWLPNILMIVAMFTRNQLLLAAYRIASAVFYGIDSLVIPIQVAELNWLHVLFAFIPPLLVPAFSSLAYFMGYRRLSILGKLMYKKKK